MITFEQITYRHPDSAGNSFQLTVPSLRINTGSVYGWHGHNGSGKSTMASILAGVVTPDNGRVEGIPQRVLYFRQDISANIFPDLRVSEHLEICHGTKRRETIASRFPDIKHLSNKYPDQLSGGELQRLAFAMVLTRDFDLYIFDEVTNHLDRETSDLIGTIMKEIVTTRPESVVVFITHDEDFLKQTADFTVCFRNGKIIANTPHFSKSDT